MSMFGDQKYFMEACGQTVGKLNVDQALLYADLIDEEVNELNKAETQAESLKELIDCMVVLIGYGHSMGWDLEGAWKEVWLSNMSKVDPNTGKVEKREDGKVLKPATYVAPDMSKYIWES